MLNYFPFEMQSKDEYFSQQQKKLMIFCILFIHHPPRSNYLLARRQVVFSYHNCQIFNEILRLQHLRVGRDLGVLFQIRAREIEHEFSHDILEKRLELVLVREKLQHGWEFVHFFFTEKNTIYFSKRSRLSCDFCEEKIFFVC